MALIINNNIPSLNAQKNLNQTNRGLSRSLERLSSGLRINRAGDDAAGLAISEKLRSQVRGLNQAIRNAGDGISLIQTAEGAFNTVTNIVQRLRELAVQSASDTNTSADRSTLKKEAELLVAEITRIGNTTEFNTKTLLNGSFSSGKVHIGANFGQSISFTLGDIRAAALGKRATVTGDLDDTASAGIDAAITAGEVNVNGTRIVTTAADDKVSVTEIVGSTIGLNSSIESGQLTINSVDIGTIASQANASAKALAIVSAINAASITDVTARVFSGTAIVLTAKNGTDLKLKAASNNASVGSLTGLTASFIGASGTETTTFNGQSSALAKAAAINAVKSDTTVSAQAKATTITGSGAITAISIANNELFINGVNIGAVTVTASDGSGALVAAINAKTSETGVVASVDSDSQLVLTAEDGRNIAITAADNIDGALGLALGGTLARAKIQLDSVSAITLSGSNPGELGDDSAGAALTATSFQPDLTNAVSTLDLTTQAGANDAILILDAALEQLNNNRSEVGALQNRLELAVENLATASENLAASESRIRDADFAAETAEFTRNQILAQAGTAILAQANTLPQLALQLLQ